MNGTIWINLLCLTLANNSRFPDSWIRPREFSAARAASIDVSGPRRALWCSTFALMFASVYQELSQDVLISGSFAGYDSPPYSRTILNNSFPCLKATSPSFLRPKRKACDTSEEPEWENNETNPKGRGFSSPQLEEAALERSGMTRFDVRISSIRSDCIWWHWRSHMMKF